eukprot:15432729-Alexandrium_andersonii.AAC.1
MVSSPGGSAPPGPPRDEPPARPPAGFVVTIGFSAQNDAEPLQTRPCGLEFEVVLGTAQLRFRTPEAILH